MKRKQILSASRRTDLPAFHLEGFIEGWKRGFFTVPHPMTGALRHIPVSPEAIGAVVFWSKDYRPLLASDIADLLLAQGVGVCFQFTVNSENPDLEPQVPALSERLSQMTELARRYGPDLIFWRFDPIAEYRLSDGVRQNNLQDFPRIARHAATLGISHVTASFLDLYAKVVRRGVRFGIRFEEIPMHRKALICHRMKAFLAPLEMTLRLCCEEEVRTRLAENTAETAHCIPSRFLEARFGVKLTHAKDSGQRPGCGCTKSIDIGSYRDHACRHDCRYCYARPISDEHP